MIVIDEMLKTEADKYEHPEPVKEKNQALCVLDLNDQNYREAESTLAKFAKAGTNNVLTIGTSAIRGLDTVCDDTCTVILAFKPKNVSEVQQAIARGARGGGRSAEGIVIQD